MRLLILSLLLLVSSYGIAQQQKHKKPQQSLRLQGGLLVDVEKRNNYLGANLLDFGWVNYHHGILTGVDLEGIYYKSEGQKRNDSSTNWLKDRSSLELIYHRSYQLKGDMDKGFFLGPSLSMLWSKTLFTPGSSTRSKTDEICHCIGLGTRLDYLQKLSKSLHLDLSTRITLLDVGNIITQGYYPTTPKALQRTKELKVNLFRPQFQLMAGISF